MNRGEAITLARAAAKQHGYALAAHGTLTRDVDLVAVPWIEAASGPYKLARAVTDAIGHPVTLERLRETVERKPHGRLAWALFPARTEPKDHGWYVDLSVMPRERG